MTRAATIGWALALVLATAVAGCKDNDQSFYIEHMKVLPDPPECKYSTGDSPETRLVVDLALVQTDDLFSGFQVTNALMARENYDTLKAESNGILVDGSETVVTIGGSSFGGSVFRGVDAYIDAESTAVLEAIVIPGSVKAALAEGLGCPPVDAAGEAVANDLMADGLAIMPEPVYYEQGYGEVKFIGHTQGGTEVETNALSFAIQACCNCSVDWSICSDPCTALCTPADTYTYCVGAMGVNVGDNQYPCNQVTNVPNADWTEMNDAGVPTEVDCTSCGA
jgi:hypothetical protein